MNRKTYSLRFKLSIISVGPTISKALSEIKKNFRHNINFFQLQPKETEVPLLNNDIKKCTTSKPKQKKTNQNIVIEKTNS